MLSSIKEISKSSTPKYNYFGTSDIPVSVTDCRNTIVTVFNKLCGKEKYCKVLADKIPLKSAKEYQGNHIMGFSHDEPTKAARIVLTIMIALMMAAPAFICRLIPAYPLKQYYLRKKIKRYHSYSNGGYTFLVMTDNLRANQALFNLYKEIFGSTGIFPCKHPVENKEFENLYLLYDPTHFLKNIPKNWQIEKIQKLKFTDPVTNKEVTARLSLK